LCTCLSAGNWRIDKLKFHLLRARAEFASDICRGGRVVHKNGTAFHARKGAIGA